MKIINEIIDIDLHKYDQENPAPELEPLIINERVYILGHCHGVVLYKRGINDNHICIALLGEDDGHWFLTNSLGSSYWLTDTQKVLEMVSEWLIKNAVKDESGYGYCFKF